MDEQIQAKSLLDWHCVDFLTLTYKGDLIPFQIHTVIYDMLC